MTFFSVLPCFELYLFVVNAWSRLKSFLLSIPSILNGKTIGLLLLGVAFLGLERTGEVLLDISFRSVVSNLETNAVNSSILRKSVALSCEIRGLKHQHYLKDISDDRIWFSSVLSAFVKLNETSPIRGLRLLSIGHSGQGQ